MIPIKGLFEAHISVRHFDRSVAFYRDVLGLELGIAQPERPAAFFWIGGPGPPAAGRFSPARPPNTTKHHSSSLPTGHKEALTPHHPPCSTWCTPLRTARP